jgi:hypothetical protein
VLIERFPATANKRYYDTSSKKGPSKSYIIIPSGNIMSIEITETIIGNGTSGDFWSRKKRSWHSEKCLTKPGKSSLTRDLDRVLIKPLEMVSWGKAEKGCRHEALSPLKHLFL